MTVKCLNPGQKFAIVHEFQVLGAQIDDMAAYYGRSRRTIIRVLEEAGVDPGIRRRTKPADSSQLQQPLPTFNREGFKELVLPKPIPTYRPWYRRILDRLVPEKKARAAQDHATQ